MDGGGQCVAGMSGNAQRHTHLRNHTRAEQRVALSRKELLRAKDQLYNTV